MHFLRKDFSFNDWQNKKVSDFRENFIISTKVEDLRSLLLLSTELNNDGVTLYLILTDIKLIDFYKFKFDMNPCLNILRIDELGTEYGNSGILELLSPDK